MFSVGFMLVAAAAIPLGFAEEEDEDERDDDPGSERSRSDRSGRSDDDDDDDRDDDRRHDGESEPRQPGRITRLGGAFDGRYVDFRLDEDNCTVLDYRLYNVTFFESIHLGGNCEADDRQGREGGSQVRLETGDAELRLHDAPNGLIRFETEDDAIVFDWPDGLVATPTKKGIELGAGPNFTGLLRVDDDDGNPSSEAGRLSVVDASGSFWAHPLSGGSPERTEIRDAIKTGHVAGEIDVLLSGDAVTAEVLQYDDVVIKVSRRNESTFRVVVDANLTQGRVFVMNVGPGLLEQGKIGVRYYDEDQDGILQEVAIKAADSLQDVLLIEEGEGPEYWVVSDLTGKHVLVAVPTFSVHAFEVMGFAVTVVPSIAVGATLGLGLVAAATLGIVPRRRQP